MTVVVWLGIALWGAVILNAGARRLAAWIDRKPLNDTDRHCGRIDVALDDELAARRALRPNGSCEVIPFPRRDGAA